MQKSRVDSGKGAGSKLINKEWSELNEWISNGDSMVQAIVSSLWKQLRMGYFPQEKRKLICNVFPESGAFTVMIQLSDKQFSSVYEKLG